MELRHKFGKPCKLLGSHTRISLVTAFILRWPLLRQRWAWKTPLFAPLADGTVPPSYLISAHHCENVWGKELLGVVPSWAGSPVWALLMSLKHGLTIPVSGCMGPVMAGPEVSYGIPAKDLPPNHLIDPMKGACMAGSDH